MKKSLLPFFVMIVWLSAFSCATAQIPTSSDLTLSVSTTNPAPGRTVTITARSYVIDINSSRVSWSVNGVAVQSGIGMTELDAIAPALGKKTNVVVTAVNPDGLTVRSAIEISSGSVDMILESNGYTPHFFKGKLSPVYQNGVKIIAMPHLANAQGVEYDPKTLIYKWEKNDRALEDQSGYSKQSILLVGEIVPRPYTLTVSVSSRDGIAQTEGSIVVSASEPSILFYIDDPLYGPLFNRAIGSIVRIGSKKETSVLAVPFGFTKPAIGVGGLTWSWMINEIKHTELSSDESVVLRAPNNSAGNSKIQLEIRNPDRILQGSRAEFSAQFNTMDSSSSEEQVSF